MSEYKWKDIEFEEYVVETIKFFNSVLAELNATGLLENLDFKVYEGFTFESVLSLTLEKNKLCFSLHNA